MIEKIRVRAKQAIAENVFPGCVIGVVRADGSREIVPLGHQTYDADSPPVQDDTIYDLASVTKSVVTASLVAMFVEEKKLSLDDAVKTFVPELQNDYDATIKDLLRYRVHGVQLSKLKFNTFEEIRSRALERGFDGPPDERAYTNLPAFVLGIVIERVAGKSLAALADEYFFQPLKMNDTTYFPHDLERIAPTEIDDRGEVRGLPHDESAYMFAKKRRSVGHAGLFSTAPDLLKFLEAFRSTYIGLPYVSSIADAAEKGLGWQVNEGWMGHGKSDKTFGKTGFTGTSILVDREKGIALVILSNRTYPKRPMDSSTINSFRSDVADSLY